MFRTKKKKNNIRIITSDILLVCDADVSVRSSLDCDFVNSNQCGYRDVSATSVRWTRRLLTSQGQGQPLMRVSLIKI